MRSDHPDTGRPDAGRRTSPTGVLVALGIVAFTYSFQQTAVLPAIDTIERSLSASPAWSAWLLSGYLMVATVLTPAFGRLADLHGEARVLLVSMVIFLAGSIGAAAVPVLPVVLVSRAAQGAGGAVLPLAFALARRYLPDEQVGRAVGGIMGAFGLGATVGFGTGGLMAQDVSWRLVFGSGATTVLVGIAVLLLALPRAAGTARGGRFDLAGALWLAATSLGVLLALTLGQQLGWTDPLPPLLLVASGLAAALWVRTELRHDEPLVDLRVLRNRVVLLVNAGTVGLGWGRFVGLLLIPELVQGVGHGHFGFGADATVAGLVMVTDGAGTTLGGPLAGLAARRWRAGPVLTAGLAVMAAALVLLAADTGSLAAVEVGTLMLGLGGGGATQASSAVTTAGVPAEDASASSALNSTVRRFAGGVGGQVSTVVLAAVAVTATASATGFTVAFAAGAALCVAGAACSVTLSLGREG